jgi:3-deoxy-7-phosphoheptulonate synthase
VVARARALTRTQVSLAQVCPGSVLTRGPRSEFERITEGLSDALDFSRTIGFTAGQDTASYERGGALGALDAVDFYTRSVTLRTSRGHGTEPTRSHEGLMLDYEEALTRAFPLPPDAARSRTQSDAPSALPTPNIRTATMANPFAAAVGDSPRRHLVSRPGAAGAGWYNTSAHFVWVGDRTRQLDGAHIEYVRGIRNPIGVKVGPSMAADELVALLDAVNPGREAGRVTLITRYGAGKIDGHLPAHIAAVQQSGHPVVWVCDPMHGKCVSPLLSVAWERR